MTCVMCGNPVGPSQIVGIGREDLYTNVGPMTAHPVCGRCFIDPTHRLLRVKVHFTSREQASVAVEMANTLDQMSREGKDLAL